MHMPTETVAASILPSPWPAPVLPDVGLTEFVLRRAAELGDKPALVDAPSGRTVTYRQLADSVGRAAAGLAARGFNAGDVLALHAPNLPEYPVAALAVAARGGAVTTANPLYTADELARQLSDSGARLLVTVPPFLETARAAARSAGVDDVLVLGTAPGATSFASLLESDGAGLPSSPVDPDSVVALLYSSGTTGLPKGVELTHRAVITNIMQVQQTLALDEKDTVMAVAPFFHTLGFTILLCQPLAHGSTVVSLPRFELEGFLHAIQTHRATASIVVPPIALALARHPAVKEYDLSSLRFLGCGAAPLSAELEQECADRLGCVVQQGYGMTEATAGIAISSMVEPHRNRRGQAGVLLPGMEARVVDPDTGADRGSGGTGELWIRGPQLMRGYRNQPEATAATIDADGWLHTGDIGRVDAEGRLFVTDRLKELIKYKGFQVAPAELEGLIETHAAVADVAVVGAPDGEAGEIPAAFIVAREEISEAELMAWVAERVAPHKRIRRVERVDAIPRSPSGKILRRQLRALL
jgi:acyl-CoA synthetase (AMP-forming)/AMP-acid ligase II